MKNKVIWLGLSFLIVVAMILASCAKSTTTSTPTSSPTSTPTSTTKTPTSTTSTSTSKPTSTPTTAGNWWDTLGKPQYGGTMTIRLPQNIGGFDMYSISGNETIMACWEESSFSFDWTLDPAVFPYKTTFTPLEYTHGQLALSYEMPDPQTLIEHLRQGIHWQNIPPANGREFIADDVALYFNRFWGLGGYGFTKPSPYATSPAALTKLKSCTATDKYTVTFKFSGASTEGILEGLVGQGKTLIECPDIVKQYGDTSDWHHAVGTGPFILTDFVSGASATLIKNPNYWGYDERYPKNQLPYIDSLKYLIIPDTATALAAIRTGKIDIMDGLSLQNSKDLQKTNPEVLQVTYPPLIGLTVDPRNDVVPYNDIRVRKALQLAIDLPTIAKTYYSGTVDPSPETFVSMYVTGWGFPYSQWPQDLKNEYVYDPTQAKKLLADAGYPNGFNTDVVAVSTADLDLLQIVQSYFASVNIKMSIQTMDLTSWIAYVQNGHKNDALAYKHQGSLGRAIPPMDMVQSYWSKNQTAWGMVNDPNYDALVDKATSATSSLADVKQALRDMTELIARQHYSVSLLNVLAYGFYQPWLKGYSGQASAISGIFTAGPSGYFYLARFWIDQDLKKSMGH